MSRLVRCTSRSVLANLVELQIDRGGPTQDLHRRLDPLAVDVDLVDDGRDAGKWTVDDLHRLAHLVIGNLNLCLLYTSPSPRD